MFAPQPTPSFQEPAHSLSREAGRQKNGKLWSVRQIEENLGHGVFSEYFEKEFPYMKNTILLAENFKGDLCS